MTEQFIHSDPFHDIHSTEPEITLRALREIRSSTFENYTYFNKTYISEYQGFLKRLIEILSKYDEPLMQYEAAWVLTNIAAGPTEQVRDVVEAGAVPLLIGLLQSRDEDVQEQAAWTLGNIIGDDHQSKGYVLSFGIVEIILNIVQHETIPQIRIPFLRIIAWILSNLCRYHDAPQPIVELKKIVPLLFSLLQHTNTEIQKDSVAALSFLTANDNELIRLVIDSNIVPTLIQLLSHRNTDIRTASLKTIRNIITALTDQGKHILRCYSGKFTRKMKQKLKEPNFEPI